MHDADLFVQPVCRVCRAAPAGQLGCLWHPSVIIMAQQMMPTLRMAAAMILLLWLLAPAADASISTCNEQAPCLDFTYECTTTGYRICMIIDHTDPACGLGSCNGFFSHVCLASPQTSIAAGRDCLASSVGCLQCGGSVRDVCKLESATSGNRLCQNVVPGT